MFFSFSVLFLCSYIFLSNKLTWVEGLYLMTHGEILVWEGMKKSEGSKGGESLLSMYRDSDPTTV